MIRENMFNPFKIHNLLDLLYISTGEKPSTLELITANKGHADLESKMFRSHAI